MKKTLKVISILVLICMIQLLLPGAIAFASDLSSSLNFITGVHLTKLDGSALGPDIAKDSDVKLEYTFAIPNIADVFAGDTFTLQIPQQILISDPEPFTIMDTSSNAIGAGTMTSGGLVTITFTDYASKHSNIHGAFWWELKFNKNEIGTHDPEHINFNVGGTSDPVTINVDFEQPATTIHKSGTYDPATKVITWTLDINPENVDVNHAYVTDTIPSGQELIAGSGKLNGTDLDLTAYYDGSTHTLTYHFPDYIGSEQTLVFKTQVLDSEFTKTNAQGTTAHEQNSATLHHDSIDTPSNTATINIPITYISKDGTYDTDARQISWTVSVDDIGVSIPDDVLTDIFPDTLTLTDGTVKADGVVLTLAPDIGSLTTSNYYISHDDTNHRYTLTHRFGAISEKHTLTFTTDIDPNYYKTNNNSTFTNTATLTGTDVPGNATVSKGVGVPSSIIKKEGNGYDAATAEISWKLTININKDSIGDAKVTDDIPLGQEYVPGSVKLNGADANPLDYNYVAASAGDPDKTGSLTYTFATNPINATYTIEFKTRVTDPNVSKANVNTYYSNTAVLEGTGITTTQSTGTQNVVSEVVKKTGNGYDYATREVTWKVVVDKDKIDLHNAVFTDNIPTGQVYVDDSATMDGVAAGFNYAAATGDPTKTGTLSYTFPENIQESHTILFKTTLTDLSIFNTNGDKTVHNTSTLTHDEVPGGVTTTGGQTIHNTVIGKSANYTTGKDYIDWTVTINSNAIPLTGGTLTDQFPAGLALDTNSVRLFNATVNPNGSLTKGSEVTLVGTNVQYVFNTRTLTFNIPAPVAGAYLLTFRTGVTDRSKSPFTNTATFNGTGSNEHSTSQQVSVSWSGSGSWGTGEVGSMNVLKVDKEHHATKLPGAVFELIDKYGNTVQRITTDSNGSALFKWLRFDVNYTLNEVTPPTGYLLPAVTSYTFQIAGGADSKDISYTYENQVIKGNIQFAKYGAHENPLAGAVFTLYDSHNAAVTTATSQADGTVSFTNIPYGDYTIRETTPPPGCKASSTVLTASIRVDGDTVYATPGSISNEENNGSITITKRIDNTTDESKAFHFTIAGPYNYSATLDIKQNESKSLSGLEWGSYTITESNGTGYDAVKFDLGGHALGNPAIVNINGSALNLAVTATNHRITGYMKIMKVDKKTGKPLAGVTFNIYADQACSILVQTVTVNDVNGAVVELPTNIYWVKEMVPPAGYLVDPNPMMAEIKAGQTTSVTSRDDLEVYNLTLVKIDGYTQGPLAGAQINLYSDAALTNLAGTGTSDATGKIVFPELVPGTYWAKEIAAPRGYKIRTDIIEVTVARNTANEFVIVNELTNTKDYQTGTDDYNLLISGGILLIVGVGILAAILIRKKRKPRGEIMRYR